METFNDQLMTAVVDADLAMFVYRAVPRIGQAARESKLNQGVSSLKLNFVLTPDPGPISK